MGLKNVLMMQQLLTAILASHYRGLQDCIVGVNKMFLCCNSSVFYITKLNTFNCGMQFIKKLHHKTFCHPTSICIKGNALLSSVVLKIENHNQI